MKRSTKYGRPLSHSLRFFFLTSAILFTVIALAQTGDKSNLQKQYNDILKEIDNYKSLLNEKGAEKKESLHYIETLNGKIGTREVLIDNIGQQVKYIDNDIEVIEQQIVQLEEDIAGMKSEYGDMLYHTYKNMSSANKLMFILSSANFNQAWQRFNYLRKYGNSRQQQAEQIEANIDAMNDKIAQLEQDKDQKLVLKQEEEEQMKILEEEMQEKNQLVAQLGQDEDKIKKQIEQKNKDAKKLDEQIQMIIAKEIAEAEEKAKKEAEKAGNSATTAPKGSTALAATPEDQQLSNDFVSNKGKLPWPVATGVVIKKFGKYAHPDYSHVTVENNGVDIKTSAGSDVRSIFGGQVVSSFYLPSIYNSIIVKHGEYFTVYSHLGSTSVKTDDKVSTKQKIGSAHTDGDLTMVHMEVWKGKTKLDPELWLAKFN